MMVVAGVGGVCQYVCVCVCVCSQLGEEHVVPHGAGGCVLGGSGYQFIPQLSVQFLFCADAKEDARARCEGVCITSRGQSNGLCGGWDVCCGSLYLYWHVYCTGR